MTPKQYKEMIAASGGFTKADTKRGDRPQPLTKADESALTNAWRKADQKSASKSKKRKEVEII